jgi:hypothetical protein
MEEGKEEWNLMIPLTPSLSHRGERKLFDSHFF